MKNKKDILLEQIDSFFKKIITYKESGEIDKFFNFLKRMPDQAPFNQALVFIQNPNCFYYATENQWKKRFNRTIRDGARPMVTLFPFGPVNFVYDYADTIGDVEVMEEELFWWKENDESNNVDFNSLLEKTIGNFQKIYKIPIIIKKDSFNFFQEYTGKTFGVAVKYVKDKSSDIQLHPRYQDKTFDKEAYGVLCHEVAHHLLGHLGEIKIKQKNNIEKIVVKDRRYLDTRIHELEAELTAWIVFLKLGEEKNSTSYLAKWISDEDDFQKISMTEILKVTNKILSLK